ncbi:MAD2 mitotic arrest deficient-like 1 [Pilobolus umbonatus]|nr:MAD2 mitotic arrest deficient-like 1 [Pilobolus umbonatus]
MSEAENISLDGSNEMIIEFFEYALYSILYQREIYTSENFYKRAYRGFKAVAPRTPALKKYVDDILVQLKAWQRQGYLSKIVIVIKGKVSFDILERWQFDIKSNNVTEVEIMTPERAKEVNDQTVRKIQNILRQITQSVSFLPLFDEPCTFNILVYANKDVVIPDDWEDSGPELIEGGGEHVRLAPVDTTSHTVNSYVAYKPQSYF